LAGAHSADYGDTISVITVHVVVTY